jgi:hypothetical protein
MQSLGAGLRLLENLGLQHHAPAVDGVIALRFDSNGTGVPVPTIVTGNVARCRSR